MQQDLKFKEILNTYDPNPYKVHIFSNDNIIYIDKKGEVFFRDHQTKQISFKLKFYGDLQFFNVRSFSLISDICILENNSEIWIIKNTGIIQKITTENNDIVRTNIRDTLTPINTNNIVYYDGTYIVLLNLNTNKVIWKSKFSLKNSIVRRFVRSGDKLFNSNGTYVFSIDLKNGRFDWKTKINKSELIKGMNDPNFIDGQMIVNNKLVFCNNEYIYSADLMTGKILWKTEKDDGLPIIFLGDNNLYIISTPTLIAVDIASRKRVWKLDNVPVESIQYKEYIVSYDIGGSYLITKKRDGSIIKKGTNKILKLNYNNFEASSENLYLISEGIVYQVDL